MTTDAAPLAAPLAVLRLLDALRDREQEVERLRRELDETNRGVLALYAELDDRAVDLRRASEMKSRFLSDVSHELRTPLASIVNLVRLLLDRTDGDLTREQEHQARLIGKSATALLEIVNDLLDLARIEAGKATVNVGELSVAELFATLRGVFRPVIASDVVSLVFEEPDPALVLRTDDGKLSQVLRNFVSNAIKFTERGEIRVSVRPLPGDLVVFAVADTGIGIAPDEQALVFEAFTQVDNHLQRAAGGTGLGLSVSRRIADLLGGHIELRSALGVGSTFSITIPRVHPDTSAAEASAPAGRNAVAGGRRW